MATTVDFGGDTLLVNDIQVGATTPGATGVSIGGGSTLASGSVFDAEQYVIASADSATYNNTGLDTNAAAAVFTTAMGGSANGAITLTAGKTYAFEACYNLTNTGTTSHTWATLFGGTATFSTGSQYQAFGCSGTAASTPASGGLQGFIASTTLSTAVVVTAASTSATEQVSVDLQGTLVINAGGTLIPQLKASARPGASGTPGVVVKAGSYFRIWQLSTGAVGNWS
jgi:hypothetical protein